MSKIKALIKLEVKDKNGKTVSTQEGPCKSFVKQFLQLIEAQVLPAIAVTNVKDVGGTNRDCRDYEDTLNSEGAATNDALGILLGTGTTAVTNADYVMETLIDHGVGGGQLSYGATAKVTATIVGANVDLQIIRPFTNASGGAINVTEVGIYSEFYDGGANRYALTLHEIVAPVAVANGQTITATITFRTTV